VGGTIGVLIAAGGIAIARQKNRWLKALADDGGTAPIPQHGSSTKTRAFSRAALDLVA
jgi:hypothetical protein